jgi:UDP-N-acetylmuramoyl-tripeptide--D-alanyl-D-alanine ligase
MLQKTEYYGKDFMEWFWNVRDFTKVQKRGKMDWTIKAKVFFILLVLSSVASLIMLVVIMYMISIYFLLLLILLPVALVVELLVVNALFSFLQKPYEKYLLRKAKVKLRKIEALKIAIAGSYGKTSQREILKTILEQGKKVATVKENFNTPFGIANFIEELSGDEEIIIFEFGEYYKGDIKYLCEFVEPHLGIITGINEAHLERFKTIENIIDTVFEISDFIGDAKVYVNTDSQYVISNKREKNLSFSKVGVETDNGIKLFSKKAGLDGTDFTVTLGKETLDCTMQLLGEHNLAPVLLAMQIGKNLGMTDKNLIMGVSKLKPFKHRMELKPLGGDLLMLDDSYNGNIDGFMAMLDFLGNINDRRIVYITPGLVEVGAKSKELHGRIASKIIEIGNLKNVVLIENSATTYLLQGLINRPDISVICFKSMPECISKLSSFTLPNDLIVIQNDWGDQYQ